MCRGNSNTYTQGGNMYNMYEFDHKQTKKVQSNSFVWHEFEFNMTR